jgi:hypothetical protein
MKMEKIRIKELIKIVQEFHGSVRLTYIPQSVIDSTEKLHELYYSGWYELGIGKFYNNNRTELVEITDSNIDEIVDEIYECLSNSVGNEIFKALDNLKLDTEDIKYFDRDPELFEKFKKEVLKLKGLNK